MPKLCPKCGAIYQDDDRFCHIDGSPLEDHPVSPPTLSKPFQPGAVPPSKSYYVGQTVLDHFEILEVCGSGSMGTVYKAFQSEIDRVVAIKILHPQLASQPEAVLRFHREAKIISNLRHPNIVHIYLFGHLPDGNLYIVQEFVDGRNLGAEMAGPMPVGRVIHVASQILSAIGEAHASGVIHRDLKPENIMLTHVGDDPDFVKILDFGVAKKIVMQTFATREGLIFGSPRYISPEAALGEKVDARSDLYSFGVILYQMLAGEPPFKGSTPVDLLMEHINSAPTALRSRPQARDVPPQLDAIVMKLLAKDPQKRYPTALAAKEAIEGVGRVVPGGALPARRGAEEAPGVQEGGRLRTAQAFENFVAVTRPDRPAAGAPKESLSDYVTNENILGTQELWALQMRREKTKKALIALALVVAVPALAAGAVFGYRFLRATFFPYDKVSAQDEGGQKHAAGGQQAGPGGKAQGGAAQGSGGAGGTQAPPPPPPTPQAEIQLADDSVPTVGAPVRFVCTLVDEKGPVTAPRFVVKSTQGLEVRIPAAPRKEGGGGWAAAYTFTDAGPYMITFVTDERAYSPAVRIHIAKKAAAGGGGGKKKKGPDEAKPGAKPIVIKEITDPAELPPALREMLAPGVVEIKPVEAPPPDEEGKPPTSIRIIESGDPGKPEPGTDVKDPGWY